MAYRDVSNTPAPMDYDVETFCPSCSWGHHVLCNPNKQSMDSDAPCACVFCYPVGRRNEPSLRVDGGHEHETRFVRDRRDPRLGLQSGLGKFG
jgi:hypothetical protein